MHQMRSAGDKLTQMRRPLLMDPNAECSAGQLVNKRHTIPWWLFLPRLRFPEVSRAVPSTPYGFRTMLLAAEKNCRCAVLLECRRGAESVEGCAACFACRALLLARRREWTQHRERHWGKATRHHNAALALCGVGHARRSTTRGCTLTPRQFWTHYL